jgi:hypothetical protein
MRSSPFYFFKGEEVHKKCAQYSLPRTIPFYPVYTDGLESGETHPPKWGAASTLLAGSTDGANIEDNGRGMDVSYCDLQIDRWTLNQGAASVLLAGTAAGANIEDNERGMVASYGDLQRDRLTLLRFVNSSRRAVHARCCRYSAVTCLCRHGKSRIETRVWIRLRRV